MNNSKNQIDIPGYYWNPTTRRYYKEDPMHPRPKESENSADLKCHRNSVKSPKHVLDILKKREMGFGKYLFEDRVITMNFENLQRVKSFTSEHEAFRPEVTFVKGGDSMYLSTGLGTNDIIEQKRHFFTPYSNIPIFDYPMFKFSVVDLCEGFNRSDYFSVLIISSDSRIWKMGLFEHRMVSPNTFVENCKPYASDTPIWCCTKNDFTERFGVGKTNVYVLCDLCCAQEVFRRRKVNGEVRSLEFNKKGNLVYIGLHTGHIEMHDTRIKDSVFRTRLHNIGIDETLLIYDENQLICGAFDGMLCNVDLRMRKPVSEYHGHIHSPRKVPFSVNEPNNLLCATGLDNVTRLWSLKGGNPINIINPPITGRTCRSWLVSDGYKCLIYQYQGSNTYVYSPGNIELLPDHKF